MRLTSCWPEVTSQNESKLSGCIQGQCHDYAVKTVSHNKLLFSLKAKHTIMTRLPVPTGVVQSATSPHRFKVIDTPSHERNSSPEDGKNPDDAGHGQSGTPEELLSWITRQILSVKDEWAFVRFVFEYL